MALPGQPVVAGQVRRAHPVLLAGLGQRVLADPHLPPSVALGDHRVLDRHLAVPGQHHRAPTGRRGPRGCRRPAPRSTSAWSPGWRRRGRGASRRRDAAAPPGARTTRRRSRPGRPGPPCGTGLRPPSWPPPCRGRGPRPAAGAAGRRARTCRRRDDRRGAGPVARPGSRGRDDDAWRRPAWAAGSGGGPCSPCSSTLEVVLDRAFVALSTVRAGLLARRGRPAPPRGCRRRAL